VCVWRAHRRIDVRRSRRRSLHHYRCTVRTKSALIDVRAAAVPIERAYSMMCPAGVTGMNAIDHELPRKTSAVLALADRHRPRVAAADWHNLHPLVR
jgi:hypothetical protein